MWRSIASGSFGQIDDEIEPTDPGRHRRQLDLARLAHGAGIERRDLAHVQVGGAQEARGVRELADVHALGVDPGPLEPGAVIAEVVSDRADQQRPQAERPHAERDVGGDPAPAHLQLVDQERQRQPLELITDELVGETAREGHQMVGGDRSRHGNTHDAKAYWLVGGDQALSRHIACVGVAFHDLATDRTAGLRPSRAMTRMVAGRS